MYGTDDIPFPEQLRLAEEGLKDSQAAGKTSLEGGFYHHLARIHTALGNLEEADKYYRWEQEIEASDGFTPKERKHQRVVFTKMLIEMCKKQGNTEGEKMFNEKLRELRKRGPKRLPGKAKP